MKNFVLLAVLLGAWTVCAQQPPAQNPPAQNPPAPTPPAPTLEQPKMEEPGTAPEEKKADVPAAKQPAPAAKAPAAKAPTHTGEGKVVEEIIARVNNEIITKSELDKARSAAAEQAQQECSGRCTQEQMQVAIEDGQKFALRDLIDQSLLSQRGKDMGISVEADVVKQMDQIRQQNKLKDMDELEKAVTSQGINWEDFKNNIRNKILTQEVIRREVGGHITVGREDAQKYYNDHKQEFVRPEQIALSAIEIKTEGKKESEIPELKAKAENLRKRVTDGEDFSELAKRFSDGSTAQQGGYLGIYKQGELTKELWDAVAPLKKKEMTGVIETKQGFLVLQVLEHYTEGEQPFDKVENEIMDKLYSERMEPALREYLKTLREQSYVVIKPGYQDMAGGGNSEIQEVSATPEQQKEKKGRKKYLLFGKTTEPKS
ncbi:MAG TPA: peptidylprolyl isomerase [Dongiaceae bacterium]|nr:peptidylprolyl isomerase [Dongiaceae bacterium]